MADYINERFNPLTSGIKSIRIEEGQAVFIVIPSMAVTLEQFELGMNYRPVENSSMVEFTVSRPSGGTQNPLYLPLGEVLSFIVGHSYVTDRIGCDAPGFSQKLATYVQRVAAQEGIALNVEDEAMYWAHEKGKAR
jgi:hypothetical protein